MNRKLRTLIERGRASEVEDEIASRNVDPEELGRALRLAAGLGHVAIVRVLIEHGASPNAADEQTGWTPLHTAVEHGQPDVIRELVARGAEVSARAEGGMTPLHLGVDVIADRVEQVGAQVDLSLVEFLLELGADPQLPDDEGASARDWARDTGIRDLVELLGVL